MSDACSLLDDVLSDTGTVTIHPRSRPWFEEHALNIVLSVQGMARYSAHSFIWRYHKDRFVLSVNALEAALGVAVASRVVARIEDAALGRRAYLVRR